MDIPLATSVGQKIPYEENFDKIVIGKEIEDSDYTANGELRTVLYHKKELNRATVYNERGYRMTVAWEDKFEYGILVQSYKKMLKTLESSILEIEQKIENFILEIQELFGDDLYFELQPVLDDNTQQSYLQKSINKMLVKLGEVYNIKCIVTTDSHYLKKEHKLLHYNFLNSKENESRETGDFYNSTYMMEKEEFIEIIFDCQSRKNFTFCHC